MTLFEDDERREALAAADDVIDLFAGPGGWSVALAELGEREVGIEYDRWACATRRAAGHPTLEADVAHLDPLDFAPCRGIIASPPCQALSNAGSKVGRRYLDELAAAIRAGDWAARPHRDPRVWLALEVGRWVEQLAPEWVTLEQVPAAFPLWDAYADWLRAAGYSCWVGKLNAADYGVPQIRHRAVLIASRVREVAAPVASHGQDGAGGLARWVTMAAALGWGMTERPGITLAPGTGRGGPDTSGAGGSGARRTLALEREANRWQVDTGRDWSIDPDTGERSWQAFDPFDQPALAFTAKAGGQWVIRPPGQDKLEEDPAPDWPHDRPATTVAGDPRVFHPGGHAANDGRDNARMVGRSDHTIRVELSDALILQGFPPGYPVRGGRTKAFEQVGNAIPPPLAAAVLRAATGSQCAGHGAG